jgi:hypothetical protein
MRTQKLGSFADRFAETKAAAEEREREREEALHLMARGEGGSAAPALEKAPVAAVVAEPVDVATSVAHGPPKPTRLGSAPAFESAPGRVEPAPAADPQSLETALPSASQSEAPPQMRTTQRRGPYTRPGVAIYESTERQITELVYFFKTYGPRVGGKLGTALLVRAALDELYDVFKTDPSRFLKRVEQAARNGAADKVS